MVTNILNAITKQLGTTFGNSYHYYVENVEQDLIKPCFTVDMVLPMERSKSAVLYDRTMPVVVHYFHNVPSTNKVTCYNKAEEIIECLEYLPYVISQGNTTKLRAENISWHMVDGVLQVFLTYRFTSQKVITPDDDMETVTRNVSHS